MSKEKVIKPRNGLIAFFLSIFFPGLGQIYNGQLVKGLLFFGLLMLIPMIAGFSRIVTTFYGFMASFIITLIFEFWIILDAILQARRKDDYVLKVYNKWYFYLLIALGFSTIFWYNDPTSIFGLQTYRQTETSNLPTIKKGDFLVADIWYNPEQQVDYGDLVVFERAENKDWTFRVVGLPLDTLKLNENILTINGQKNEVKKLGENQFKNSKVNEFQVRLPNEHKHRIFKFKKAPGKVKRNFEQIVVPEGNYYLLGDNRDHAYDSRYIGPINKDQIIGRVVFSYWGESTDRININFREK